MTEAVLAGPEEKPHGGLRTLTHILYGLHLLSWFSAGAFSLIAMVINYIKRPDLPDELFRSHFRWQARSFWFTLLWLLVYGLLIITLIGLWYLYRFVRGWLSFAESRSMPLPS